MCDDEIQNKLRILSTNIEQLYQNDTASLDPQRASLLDELKAEYNQIIDHNYHDDSLVYPDPLEVLPSEIGEMILHETVVKPIENFYALDSNSLLTLTLVSRRWQSIIIDTPSLWTTIEISDKIPDLLSRIAVHMELSQDSPLTLFFLTHQFPWTDIRDMLKTHQERIRAIWMERGLISESLDSVLMFLSPLSQLKEIGDHPPGDGVSLGSAWKTMQSSLVHAHNVILDHEMLSHANTIFLRTFSTNDSLDLILPILGRLRSLEKVSIIDPAWQYLPTLLSIQAPNIAAVLPIRSFIYRQDPRFPLWLLPRLVNLVELSICISSDIVSKFLGELKGLSLLKFLHLDIVTSKSQEASYITTLEPFLNITQLHLRFQALETAMVPFYQNVSKLFPSLSELSLFSLGFSILAHILHLSGFQKLSKLIICCYSVQKTTDASIKAPSEVKSVKATVPFSLIWQFYCPSATTIQLDIVYNREELEASEIMATEPPHTHSDLPSVQHVNASMNPFIFADHSSRTLREITLTLQQTSFCCSLALHPQAFPVLYRINFLQHPSWDIFFLMLERRNFFSRTVAPISSVTLPSNYPRALFRPMQDLLRQRIPGRPSNRELSDTQASERLLDLTV
jgi:hypothetical protein